MSHSRKSNDTTFMENLSGKFLSAVTVATVFHPWDTFGKRMANSEEQIFTGQRLKELMKSETRKSSAMQIMGKLNEATFLDKHHLPFSTRFPTLYAGIGTGLVYKTGQFTYKFVCQPYVKKFLQKSGIEEFMSKFSSAKFANVMTEGLAGSLTGFIEALLFLPLDMLKVLRQNRPDLSNISGFEIISSEYKRGGLKALYKGIALTVPRNILGSGALFLFPELIYTYVLHQKQSEAAWGIQFLANGLGGMASVVVANPFDMGKIRLQSKLEDKLISDLYKNILKNEGWSAMFKGVGVKVVTQAPKLAAARFCADNFTAGIHYLGIFPRKQNKEEMKLITCSLSEGKGKGMGRE